MLASTWSIALGSLIGFWIYNVLKAELSICQQMHVGCERKRCVKDDLKVLRWRKL